MAIEKCRDCGKEISASARRCPHCGKYHWTGGRILGAIVVLLFGYFMIRGCAGI